MVQPEQEFASESGAWGQQAGACTGCGTRHTYTPSGGTVRAGGALSPQGASRLGAFSMRMSRRDRLSHAPLSQLLHAAGGNSHPVPHVRKQRLRALSALREATPRQLVFEPRSV